ncbi:hypothetical protein EV178_003889 [Coemansia sp. RSA 1646]|nr:hypothetical protein EV178_003889 [Coemansia sp. RSA 1646]KAJ1770435.1 hypothetical protein LPJ74_003170 [Coemansia sp. RSA 1843]KAJ2212564.1 hypothetical protein EV179_004546 [Coemansia sp. RSA 487]
MVLNALRDATFKNPFAIWGLGLGFLGPLLVVVVPPIRDATGFVSPKAIPQHYPLPQRERRPTQGYEDKN